MVALLTCSLSACANDSGPEWIEVRLVQTGRDVGAEGDPCDITGATPHEVAFAGSSQVLGVLDPADTVGEVETGYATVEPPDVALSCVERYVVDIPDGEEKGSGVIVQEAGGEIPAFGMKWEGEPICLTIRPDGESGSMGNC